MSGAELGLAVSVFLACAVEAVEALTIVLAMGTTRSWRSTWYGVAAATVALAVVVAIVGPALTSLPLGVLRVVVGGLLLLFGLRWLRKAILRSGGIIALHDEARIFEEERAALRGGGGDDRATSTCSASLPRSRPSFWKGSRSCSSSSRSARRPAPLVPACAGAAAAGLIVVGAGAVVHRPLARVPENALKFTVGVLLSAFGTFWSAEGAGAHWPGGDAALLVIIPGLLIAALTIVSWLRRAVASRLVERSA